MFMLTCATFDDVIKWVRPGHARPDGTSSPQPATNVDATAFIFEKFSEMVTKTQVGNAAVNGGGDTNLAIE